MTTMLVLGGTSWVGGCIAREALGRGHDVTCLARGESGQAPAGATFVRADRSAPGAYDAVADRAWDLVVDLSRQPGQVRSAVAALGGRAGHWTFVSTGSVYADQSGPLTEASPLLEPLEADEATPEEYGHAKVACEQAVTTLPRHLVVRAGLIGGPGDRSDRLGYYVSRFALAGDQDVLVPDAANQPMQVIDVRDLAAWIVRSAERGATGIVHGAGSRTTVGELIAVSAEVSGFTGRRVVPEVDWLHEHGVQEWMGPRSLPLWLPASHHGMGRMDDARAIGWGLVRRPLDRTLADTLADERDRGLDRPRAAGLSRAEELQLLAELA
ncbi:NAD-dependent epimerase/dehydratase family protein [Aeromicrobium wangtongii]|uniref:NAD-dependent epimerase/dehydratase family protein n=1 Tax=Aeromicrobium wangtongii TaxID=2969247 RepID=UPI002017B59C|nr:NAD-dependent epimerase/dehydratase family protein [Aeromicrobium wangtongii]MCL3817082.1 NAD-dependent epimerase/dehydratase family protein [Aeromicrobium wangtongii]